MEVMMKELGEIITGNTPSKKTEAFWSSEDICFIKPDIIADDGINEIVDSNEYISEDARKKARVVGKNSIFITCIGSIGKIGIASDGEYAFNQQINAIIPNDRVQPKYLAYNLLFNKPRLVAIANAPVVPIINKSQFGEFTVNIETDIDRQCEIVDVLDKFTQIIQQRNKEISALDELIKARFVEMFGDAVANPMNWPVKKLKDLSVQINSGNTPKGGSENYVKDGITFFRSQNVWKDRLEMDDIAYIDVETHESMKRSSLKHGDILMTKTGRINTENSSLGRAALYMGEDDMANVNGHVYFIRLKPEVNNKFVLRILVSPEYRDLIRRVCVGGIDKRQLNKEHIEDFPIICPPSDMIDEYVVFADQVNKSKVKVQKALDETQKLFDSLMQQYFG
ncbi:restriction endonuclease subunit S [Blautia massiliensis (ex Durand et al. 2017)]|uniref:restriction endonuclease subunit S n=1 Tax=Blautia massiliensis (ex Durand et al. 2017) TaxID=1737424 RepID=UPI00241DC07C|nr:restriction endonuclease subunit S [Blautia massiliensis (ex Durand et al. 2017)]MBN2956521.1 restriction endonuclease subunit S [Blautia massiliensis (ex Durand et al. 2017)]